MKKATKTFKFTKKQQEGNIFLGQAAENLGIDGGSRSGKTFLLTRAIMRRAMKVAESRHLITRYRFNAAKRALIYDTLPKVRDLCFPGAYTDQDINKTDWFIELRNGSQIWIGGLDDKERTEKVLGTEYATIFANECSEIPYDSILTVKTRLAQNIGLPLKFYHDLNPPSKAHWSYLLFYKGIDPATGKPLPDPENYRVMKMNPQDNADNLPESYIRMLNNLPERQRKRFYLGEYADVDENALWTDKTLEKCRLLGRMTESIPDFQRVIVSIDPSGCSGPEDERSDEIGITVTGLGTNGDGYLIEDLSGRFGPNEWGKIAVTAYHRHQADLIVGEINFGGAMVEAVIRAEDSTVAFKQVRASRGKVARAEPIASLYENGKIHHIGYFPELEAQYLAMSTDGYHGLKSPDRADSAIWGFSELFPGLTQRQQPKRNITIPAAYSAFA